MRASVIAFGSLLIQQYAHNQQYGHAHRHNTDINNGYGGQVKAHLIVVKECTPPTSIEQTFID